jgi:hypothetical protein
MDQPPEIKRHTIFDCLSPNCGATLVSAVAEILAEGLLPLQIDALGAFLAAVGDTLAYIATQKELNELMCPKKRTITAQTEDGEGTSGEAPQGGAGTGEITVIH